MPSRHAEEPDNPARRAGGAHGKCPPLSDNHRSPIPRRVVVAQRRAKFLFPGPALARIARVARPALPGITLVTLTLARIARGFVDTPRRNLVDTLHRNLVDARNVTNGPDRLAEDGIVLLGHRGRGLSRRVGRRIPPLITTVAPPTTANQKKTPTNSAPWSTPTGPKLPSWPLPAKASSDITNAPATEAASSLTSAARTAARPPRPTTPR